LQENRFQALITAKPCAFFSYTPKI